MVLSIAINYFVYKMRDDVTLGVSHGDQKNESRPESFLDYVLVNC